MKPPSSTARRAPRMPSASVPPGMDNMYTDIVYVP